MAVVCYQAVAQFILPDVVAAVNFPRLAALAERAMKISAFASTVPHLQMQVGDVAITRSKLAGTRFFRTTA